MNIKYFLAALAAAVFISCSEKDKTETIFNGEDLSGWKVVVKANEGEEVEGETFSAKDGLLHITGKPFGYIRTGLLMGGIKIEGVDGPFYRKNRLVEESPEKPVGEWNKMEFLCKGGEIKVWLNGILVNDAVCDATEGYIAIQSEGGAMDFRNIVLSF